MNALRIFVGYDPREALAYHVCVNSLIRYASRPLAITPLALNNMAGFYCEGHSGGSNDFAFSRFLVPYMVNFSGPALYLDGDMVVREDIAKLFALAEVDKDVMVVQHNYETKHPVKYFGAINESFARKNWASVMLFPNCSNFPCQKLTPAKVQESSGKFLHRFEWTSTDRIGSLPIEWNWLCSEYEKNNKAKLLHWTAGSPFIKGYGTSDSSEIWWEEYHLMMTNFFKPDDVQHMDCTPRTKALIY